MEARASVKYARISSRKVKIVLDLIRGKEAGYAMGILKNTPKAASEILEKLLKSAMANATNNFGMDASKLYALGWKPVYSIDDTLEKLVNSMRKTRS